MAKMPTPPKRAAAKPATVKANSLRVCGPSGTEKSVEIRKIENGFIVRESSYGPKGQYKSTERFSPSAPTVQVAPTKGK